jgi:glyoxylase-like metal-dependent hydrolase (beta-lactamase superfamily II)
MEIAAGVHAVPLLGATGHLICEDRLTLIDAGLPGSRRRLARYVGGLGRSLDELVRIVCTHGHPDHVGGVRELASDLIEVLMHPADEARLHITLRQALRRPSRGKLFAYAARTPTRTIPIEDGDVLPVLDGLEVIHTPGHSPGSVCLYAARDRLLFVGDELDGRPIFITHGTADSRLSVQYAADLAAAYRANGGTVDPWIVPGADHTQAIALQPAEYERRLDAFFESTIGGV